jgi:capsular polysaccharide biosynthesis protein/Mrp family chromosome partitioning ATPase
VTKYDALPSAPSSHSPPSHPGSATALAPSVERMRFSRFAERTIDGEQEFSVREILDRILVRKWTLVICIIIPTLLSLAITLLTPLTWTAATKILIRYGSSESVFLKGLIPDDRVSISAAASSEIMRSLPTLEDVVREQDIQDSDLYLSTTKVISERLSGLYHAIFKSQKPATPEEKLISTAKRLQDSLQAASTLSRVGGKADAIEVLANNSAVPQALKGDELITLTVKAFNREKVADVANGIAQAFFVQYNNISAQDAHRSVEFLSQLAERLEIDIRQLEQNLAAPSSASSDGVFADGNGGRIANESPMMTALATQLATLEARLQRAQQIYAEGSPEIERQKAEIDHTRALFSGRERLEAAKQALEQIRERRFQAENTERMYKSYLVPISVIEPALRPPPSTSAQIMRLSLSGATGFLIGIAIGLGVVIVLGVLDQRLFTASDVERSLALPVLGWLPQFVGLGRSKAGLSTVNESAILAADDGLSHLIARIHGRGRESPEVVAIASAGDDDGKSFVSLLLAKAIARGSQSKILLVDGDPFRASLTKRFAHSVTFDSIGPVTDPSLPGIIVHTDDSNVDLVPQVSGPDEGAAGYSAWLRYSLDQASGLYNLVIVDTPSLTLSGRSLICCKQADWVLVIVKCGVSRRGPIKDFLHKLQEIAVTPPGAILNFQTRVRSRPTHRHY